MKAIMYEPIDAVVKDLMGNIGFLDRLFSRNTLLVGTLGILAVLTFIIIFFR
jgi:hypothetical protein